MVKITPRLSNDFSFIRGDEAVKNMFSLKFGRIILPLCSCWITQWMNIFMSRLNDVAGPLLRQGKSIKFESKWQPLWHFYSTWYKKDKRKKCWKFKMNFLSSIMFLTAFISDVCNALILTPPSHLDIKTNWKNSGINVRWLTLSIKPFFKWGINLGNKFLYRED